ncbi:MAG: LysM peptidoglycan-binding domain-containing protein, partial [Chloroflexota bacterium]
MRCALHARILLPTIAFCLLTVMTGACGGNAADSEISEQSYEITLYQTLTPAPISTSDSSQVEPSQITSASPTPLIYKIVANDTLIGIATRFNIALEALVAANPGLDPNFLIVGADLLIPAGAGSITSELPTPTPVAIIIQSPHC